MNGGVQKLDTNTMEWVQLPSSQEYPVDVSHGCAAPLGSSSIIAVGGWTPNGGNIDNYSSAVYAIDTNDLEQGWRRLADLNIARGNHDCVAVIFCLFPMPKNTVIFFLTVARWSHIGGRRRDFFRRNSQRGDLRSK